MNNKVIAKEYLIDLDLPGKIKRQETIDIPAEIIKAVIYGLEYKHKEIIQKNAFRSDLRHFY